MNKSEYKALTIPQIKWNAKVMTNTYGELVAQPLEPGFGITVGNALRRTLLSSVEGSAVTSIIVKGVNNEFSTLPGVVEDAMQVVLNIKQVVIKNATGMPGSMRLHVKGEAVATVADIVADSHLSLVNKDHVIAHVSANGELDIEFFVESGRGYRPAQWPEGKPLQDDNRIYLDAMFSPVSRVEMDVRKTRVGRDIDYDELILRISTNGAETPQDVLHYSVSVLRTQLENFLMAAEIPFNQISATVPSAVPTVQIRRSDDFHGISPEFLLKSIEELELSARAHNCLENHGIKRILDLVNMTEDEALKIKNFGRKSVTEVRESMKQLGLSFGMNIDEEEVLSAVGNDHE